MKVALIGTRNTEAFVASIQPKADCILTFSHLAKGIAYIVDPETVVLTDLATGEVTRPILDAVRKNEEGDDSPI